MNIYDLAQKLQPIYGADNIRVESGYIFILINNETYRISIDRERK